MIKCPRCQHEELEGSLFCSECGAQLVEVDPSAFMTATMNQSEFAPLAEAAPEKTLESTKPTLTGKEIRVYLLVIDNGGRRIELEGRKEYSLGRIADGQLILPDVDLSNYDAFTLGVSRLHATIKLSGSIIVITDLASSNGTRVNGQKIGKYVDYPLSDGDVIALGKLRLKIVIEEKK